MGWELKQKILKLSNFIKEKREKLIRVAFHVRRNEIRFIVAHVYVFLIKVLFSFPLNRILLKDTLK